MVYELSSEYKDALNHLRQLRERAGLTLKGVEEKSEGRWKAGAIGSYERGTRILTLERAIELLDFYGAQLSALTPSFNDTDQRVVIDLRRLRNISSADNLTLALRNLTQRIKFARNDWNAELISLRETDFQILQSVTGHLHQSFVAALELRGLLIKAKNQ